MTLTRDALWLLIEESVSNDGVEPLDFICVHPPVVLVFTGARIDLPACPVAMDQAGSGGRDSRHRDGVRPYRLDRRYGCGR
jgi:hypothetical protein